MFGAVLFLALRYPLVYVVEFKDSRPVEIHKSRVVHEKLLQVIRSLLVLLVLVGYELLPHLNEAKGAVAATHGLVHVNEERLLELDPGFRYVAHLRALPSAPVAAR